MKKGFAAASMITVTGLGLGCPSVLFAQAVGSQPQENNLGAESPTASQGSTSTSSEPAPSNTGTADAPAALPSADKPQPPPGENGLPAAQPVPGPPPAADSGTGLETVVVTARRTAESLQKVPVAVTAFSAKDLERRQISSAQDLNGLVPSLVINTGSATRNVETPTIRGQGASFGASPGVIIYYAEVPLPSDSFSNQQGGPGKFFDLANLQVLKGSQGTLFGRNTTGGALLLEPHKPDPGFDASIRAELGNLQDKGMEGILNVPLVDDQLLLRMGVKYYEREGFTKDIANNEDLDGKGYRTMRLGLMWKPADNLQDYLLGYYTHSADTGTSEVLEQINSTAMLGPVRIGCAAVALGAGGNYSANYQNCGQDVIAAQQARGVRAVDLSTPPDDILDTGGVIDTFSYDMNNQLSLRNIGSYQMYKHHFRWDQDGSVLVLNDFNPADNVDASDLETYTEELQLQGHAFDNTLKFVGGAFYQYTRPLSPSENYAVEFSYISTRVNSSVSTRSYGPYAQATYDFGGLSEALEGLNLTVGGRYSSDDTSGTATTGSYLINTNTALSGGKPVGNNIRNSAPTYTAGLDYKVPTTMLYAKISRGYKSGGISPEAVTPSRYTYKPEYVTNYEVGSKSDFRIGDIPARVDSSLYYTDYTDIQRATPDNYQAQFGATIVNAAKASIEGLETEITIQPAEGLSILLNYSYTYARYSEFTLPLSGITPVVDCTGRSIAIGATSQLQCIPFNFVPRHQGSLTTRYQLPLESGLGKIDGSLTYSFTDRQYTSAITVPQAEPGAWLGAYGLLSAGLDWTAIHGSALDMHLFGNNLTDRTYRISNSNVWNFLYFQSSIYGEPRTYGLSLDYHWGS